MLRNDLFFVLHAPGVTGQHGIGLYWVRMFGWEAQHNVVVQCVHPRNQTDSRYVYLL